MIPQVYPTPALPQHVQKPSTNRRWLPWLILGGTTMAGFFMLVCAVSVIGITYLTKDRMPSGVSVAGIDVGGASRTDAAAALQLGTSAQTLTVTDGDRRWTVSLGDLGISVDTNATLQAAIAAGKNAAIQPYYTIDLSQAQDGLIALSELANIAALPGNPPQLGRSIEIPVVLDRLRLDVTSELADGILDLTMIEVAPPEPETVTSENYTGVTVTHIVEGGQELALIARQYGVAMEDIVSLNAIENPDLLYVGQELIIPASGEYVPPAEEIPAAPSNVGKSILVSSANQRIYAYENGVLVHTHLVSTGRDATPTVLGDYSIYVKYVADDMSGPDYFLPQVPYTMYFYRGYGIHGTYWHNSFGRAMSHGCVNLPVAEAEWFFNWAEVGTPVRVI